jgi:hypothetical protein
MGSSAALITSLVSALLIHFAAVTETDFANLEGDGRRLAHNAAQFVHCLAQGKVGSGFDVAAAVFGSQIYRRFKPAVLDPLMKGDVCYEAVPLPASRSFFQDCNRHVEGCPELQRLGLQLPAHPASSVDKTGAS